MKKLFTSLLLGCMLMCGQSLLSTSQAEAAEVEINNQIGKNLSVAIIHFNEDNNKWICQGWWIVPANSFKTISFNKHNKNSFWVHMHNKDRSWGHERAWTVTNEAFKYEAGTTCPPGSNRRQVAFNRYDIGQDGSIRVTARN